MKPKLFTPEMFTPTQWDTAEDKAKFANAFVRFVQGNFKPSLFPRWFYKRLSMIGNHIAHYNKNGFYAEWFSTTSDRLRFLRHWATHVAYGQPECTYADVERKLTAWIREGSLVEQYETCLRIETEGHERELLKTLQAKYGAAT